MSIPNYPTLANKLINKADINSGKPPAPQPSRQQTIATPLFHSSVGVLPAPQFPTGTLILIPGASLL
ncbi:MAG: hypothetical protein KME26_03690 [Oscillatoria princeps RMCB-10]|nr:hypothetical protein [Oscillatoria princeps RMCB-10]